MKEQKEYAVKLFFDDGRKGILPVPAFTEKEAEEKIRYMHVNGKTLTLKNGHVVDFNEVVYVEILNECELNY